MVDVTNINFDVVCLVGLTAGLERQLEDSCEKEHLIVPANYCDCPRTYLDRNTKLRLPSSCKPWKVRYTTSDSMHDASSIVALV